VQLPEPLAAAAIRDTVAAVFRAPGYNRVRTLGERFWEQVGRLIEWLARLFAPLRDVARDSPLVYWTLVVLLATALAAVLGRLAYLAYLRRTGTAMGSGLPGAWGRGPEGDAWLLAQRLSTEGHYTDAAHALYRALLEAAARQGDVRLHPSKTVGDYLRELRARSSRLVSRFRDFARSYEVVIYGLGECDQERYERLFALAHPIIRPND
jgi:uncharacterized protein DUF4129